MGIPAVAVEQQMRLRGQMAAHSQLECVPMKGNQQGMSTELEGTEAERGGELTRQAGAD